YVLGRNFQGNGAQVDSHHPLDDGKDEGDSWSPIGGEPPEPEHYRPFIFAQNFESADENEGDARERDQDCHCHRVTPFALSSADHHDVAGELPDAVTGSPWGPLVGSSDSVPPRFALSRSAICR